MAQLESEDKLLISRAEDALRIAGDRYCVKTLGFLNPHQRALVERHLLPDPDMCVEFDGGYAEAERTLLVCRPEYCIPGPEEYLCLLEFTGRDTAELSHRDYLGSLMGLGITRENIGDILVLENRALAFVKPEIAAYIMQNLTKIGRCGVHIRRTSPAEAEIPPRPVRDVQGTVSSLRLDSVLSAGIGVSRSKAADLIRGGLVTVNWELVQDVSASLREGDVISVRGHGRMKLSQIGGLTRKNRYSITVSRYV